MDDANMLGHPRAVDVPDLDAETLDHADAVDVPEAQHDPDISKPHVDDNQESPGSSSNFSRYNEAILTTYHSLFAQRMSRRRMLAGIGAGVIALGAIGAIGAACAARSCGKVGALSTSEVHSADDDVSNAAPIEDILEPVRVSFCAFGDNLANEGILEVADGWAGEYGDGQYDFHPFYTDIAPIAQSFDIAFINQETTLGGTDYFGYSGYPSYNTPDSMAEAVVDAGFDVVNCNTNHTYDYWVEPIEHSHEVWAQYPDVQILGSYRTQQDRLDGVVVERKGIRIGFLSYCYGITGRDPATFPNDWYATLYDEDAIVQDYERIRKKCDAVVVYIHGGTEYDNWPDDWEWNAAQYCADLGADVIIMSHVHVIQPVVWLERSDGSGYVPCAFSLGDFLSGYFDHPELVLSGMFSCDFVQDVRTGAVRVEDVAWLPLIEYRRTREDGTIDSRVVPVRDLTPDMCYNNELYQALGPDIDRLTWAADRVNDVIGTAVRVDM